jgi:ABC-type oligopeptide transport system substrate-binding subunit/class 3 adenylate cyclase
MLGEAELPENTLICARCGFDCPSDFAFCPKCGSKLTVVCPQCGFESAPEFAYCPKCGTPLTGDGEPDRAVERLKRLAPSGYAERVLAAEGGSAGERRVVTILFCDVKGSTTMAEALDPEDVMEIMDGAFDVMIEPIVRYEGTVARLMGDAVLAFFGAPVTHEDDPERACRAALEIVEGARPYAEKLARERGISGFNVRVGINTGLVVVGEVGSDLRVEYTAMGDAINVAARLEEAAKPGTVLITGETHKLIAPLIETEPVGPVEVKGKVEPVPTYRVVALKGVPGKARGIAGLESPLVGRDAEFRALQEAVERLEAGVGGIVTIVGEAGIGKSRLVAEVRKRNLAKVHEPEGSREPWQGAAPGRTGSASRLEWVEGRCLSYGTSVAYLLWLDVLRELLELAVDDSPDVVRNRLRDAVEAWCPDGFDVVYPYLTRLMSLPAESEGEEALSAVEGERLKSGTFRAVERLIECAADVRPLVLACEDVHWADPTSIELLESVFSLTDRCSLLVMCVFRPQAAHTSWRLRETAARKYWHRHTDLWVEPLSAAESERLVDSLLGGTAPGSDLAQGLPQKLKWRILSRAEGNPFYVEEVVRSLVDSEAIVADQATGRWEVTRDVTDIPIPETIQAVLMARIDRLEEEARRVLQMASVIGRIFLYRVLAEIAAAHRDLEEKLLTLQREQLIRERARLPELEYIFKHELTREAAYNGLLKRERRVFHRQVAEALERLFPERVEELVGPLAHHWERAGVADKAIAYLLRAGDQARMVYAHEEATDYYRRALVFLKEQGEDRRVAETLMKLGLVHTAAFQPQKAREAYDEGFALWKPGWTSGELPDRPVPASVLRFAVDEPLSLDPGRVGDDISMFITGQLFQGLVEVDEDYNVLPGMAAHWEVTEQGMKYVFRLREGLRWSDGTRLTASDLEYAWKRNLSPATASRVAHLLYAVENARAFGEGEIADPERVGVWALDEDTLAVRLEAPTAYFLHLMAHPVACPLPQRAVEAGGERWTDPENLVSNGPYRLMAWQRGELLVLEKNPQYRGPFSGNAHRVECPVFADFESALEAYADNDLDIVSMIGFDPGTVARVRGMYGDELLLMPQLSTVHIVFPVDCQPFDDVRVRQAFVHAVDREGIVREVWSGLYRSASGGFVPPGMPGHSKDLGLAYDPDGARLLLDEAGYPGGGRFPDVKLIYWGGSGPEPVVSFLQDAWRRTLGVSVEAMSVGWEDLAERRDPAGLVLCGWRADYPDPDHMLRATFHSVEGLNMPGWRNTRFDRLVEEAARIADEGRRMELYREADRILVAEEAVVMPLGYAQGRILRKQWVTVPRVPPALLRLKDVVCRARGQGRREM